MFLFNWIYKHILLLGWWLGLYLPPDRKILEKSIFPQYKNKENFNRILFVGIKRYCKHYKFFFQDQTYITLDPNPSMKRYAAKWHVVDSLENLTAHFAPSFFDLIIINGVIGWGLNELENINKSLMACYHSLREGGELIIGVNEDLHAIEINSLESIKKFKFFREKSFKISSFLSKSHTYYFFQKPKLSASLS